MLQELPRTEAFPEVRSLTDAESAAMARAVLRLFAHWGLSDAEARDILGGLAARTYARWKAGDPGRIDRDLATRLSLLMGIHKGLRYLFTEPERGYAWVRKPNSDLDGRSPAEIMAEGSIFSLARVRHYLDAERGGWSSTELAVVPVIWPKAFRLIRSIHPPIDLFEDIADPRDWEALASAESKTNPRLWAHLGRLDLVPPERRVNGPGASYLMAPFVHVSTDRPGRFTDGSYGVYSAGSAEEVAIREVAYHHGRAMAATAEGPGWTSQFRMLVNRLNLDLHDARPDERYHHPGDYSESQALGRRLRREGSNGIVYRSVRCAGGECAAIFWPDVIQAPVQAAHFDFHWDGETVDRIRNCGTGAIFGL